MSVRALDSNGDWTFGQGKNNYISANAEVAQDIQTRLNSFLGNCFFDLGAGIDWFNFLSGKNELGLSLAVSASILNSPYVTALNQLSISLNSSRECQISYSVTTAYSTTNSNVVTIAI